MATVEEAVRSPQRWLPGHSGRRQLIASIEDGHAVVVAVVEEFPPDEIVIVTVIRSTDLNRYWRRAYLP
jgi:hypothetical protein